MANAIRSARLVILLVAVAAMASFPASWWGLGAVSAGPWRYPPCQQQPQTCRYKATCMKRDVCIKTHFPSTAASGGHVRATQKRSSSSNVARQSPRAPKLRSRSARRKASAPGARAAASCRAASAIHACRSCSRRQRSSCDERAKSPRRSLSLKFLGVSLGETQHEVEARV